MKLGTRIRQCLKINFLYNHTIIQIQTVTRDTGEQGNGKLKKGRNLLDKYL